MVSGRPLLPVKKTAQAVGFYLGDYLVKTYNLIPPGQKCRLVRFSQRINRAICTKFSIRSLGNLIYRTRLKIVAGMLNFQDYGDFAEYFWPRWHFYIKNDIAWVPMPFKFMKGAFESGKAALHAMISAQKSAYRYLLFHAMLDIRVYCQSRGEPSTDAAVRERQYHASRIAGGIADWLHNLAKASVDDFEWFDEDTFWKTHAYFCTRFPGEPERYRTVFDERLK